MYLNSLVRDRNIFRSSSKVFGNLRKFSENVRERSSGLLNNCGKSSQSGRKSSKNRQKCCHQYVYIIKRTLHVSSKISILCSCHKNTKFICSIHVLSSLYFLTCWNLSSGHLGSFNYSLLRHYLCISQIEASTSPPPGYLTPFPAQEGGDLITTHRGWGI